MTATGGGQPDLSAFQLEMAKMFFALPASEGFLLAGGAALLARHLTARPTEGLDFFTAPEQGHVPAARDAIETAVSCTGKPGSAASPSGDCATAFVSRGTGDRWAAFKGRD